MNTQEAILFFSLMVIGYIGYRLGDAAMNRYQAWKELNEDEHA